LKKIVIVSNRLPLKVEKNEQSLVFTPTSGGLATGLKSVHQNGNALWIGWPGLTKEELSPAQLKETDAALSELRFKAVHLDQAKLKTFTWGFLINLSGLSFITLSKM